MNPFEKRAREIREQIQKNMPRDESAARKARNEDLEARESSVSAINERVYPVLLEAVQGLGKIGHSAYVNLSSRGRLASVTLRIGQEASQPRGLTMSASKSFYLLVIATDGSFKVTVGGGMTSDHQLAEVPYDGIDAAIATAWEELMVRYFTANKG